MAASLARWRVVEFGQRAHHLRTRQVSRSSHAQALGSQQLIAHKMQANDFGRLTLIKVAMHCVLHCGTQLGFGIGFGKYGLAQSTRGVATLGSQFNYKYDFSHLASPDQDKAPIDCATGKPFATVYSS